MHGLPQKLKDKNLYEILINSTLKEEIMPQNLLPNVIEMDGHFFIENYIKYRDDNYNIIKEYYIIFDAGGNNINAYSYTELHPSYILMKVSSRPQYSDTRIIYITKLSDNNLDIQITHSGQEAYNIYNVNSIDTQFLADDIKNKIENTIRNINDIIRKM